MTHPWPLPQTAHLPGQTPRPRVSPAFDAADAAAPRTDPAAWRANQSYLYGIALHDAGFFWEAHEVWEAVWTGAAPNGRARRLLGGLIQLANAWLKLRMERPGAALRLLGLAARQLGEAGPDPVMGLAPGPLVAAIAEAEGALKAKVAPDRVLRARPHLAAMLKDAA